MLGKTLEANKDLVVLLGLGPVVRKQISANPGLKVNGEFYFSCLKMFLKAKKT